MELLAPRYRSTRAHDGEFPHHAANDVGEVFCGEFWRWRAERLAGPVKSQNDVKVHEPATLEFGDLQIVQSDVPRELFERDAESYGKFASSLFVGSVPQPRRLGVPDDRVGNAVTEVTEWTADLDRKSVV